MTKSFKYLILISFLMIVYSSCNSDSRTKATENLISDIKTHILMDGESHSGLWLGPGVFCKPGNPPQNFHFFFSESDRKGGDSVRKYRYFVTESAPSGNEGFNGWWKTWKEQNFPQPLHSRFDKEGFEWVPTFNWQYNRPSHSWLGIGTLLRQKDSKLSDHVQHLAIAYATYTADSQQFEDWKSFRISLKNEEKPCVAYGQRVDLENGDVVVPFSVIKEFNGRNSIRWCGTVFCHFDGKVLSPYKQSNLVTNPVPRGLYEPSLTLYNNKYLMSLRAEDGYGYVTVSDDAMTWNEPVPWSWDDGTAIDMNQTMTKFITHSHGLYLVYTRILPDNDNVFRNRAPLFIARVDDGNVCLIKESEQIIFPNNGFPLGNFNVHTVSPLESWVTVPEWDRTGRDIPCNNLLGRIVWSKPNELVSNE